MKRIVIAFLAAAALMLAAGQAYAQRLSVRSEVRADRNLACGPDIVYNFDVPALTPAPEGYEPVYVGVYARHGSRYAYTAKTYTRTRAVLEKGAAEGNLTPLGEELCAAVVAFHDKYGLRVGDLTRKGWDQHRRIAAIMLDSFPEAFPQGARIDACVSPSLRSAISMTSFCLSMGQKRPDLDIYEHQSLEDLPAARPNMGDNPNPLPSCVPPCPSEAVSVPEYFDRMFSWKSLLSKIFKDPVKGIGKYEPWSIMDYFYMLYAGMQSLDPEVVPNLPEVFTDEEFARLWDADNYLRYREYYPYMSSCCSIWDDIIAKADGRLAAGERGADLRFGHDHCLLTLLMIVGMEGFGVFPERAEDVALYFQNFRSPMASNIQAVFYRPLSGAGETLVKFVFNGEEATVDALSPVSGPYYRWDDFKALYASRRKLFVAE